MSKSPTSLPENAPFGQKQKEALNSLISTLDASQTAWLSGFLAGLGQEKGEGASGHSSETSAVPMTILYGSESGNAEGCADEAANLAKNAGFKVSVCDMADYDRSNLPKEENVLVIVSTWGEGDPPEGAVDFHEYFMSDAAPRFKQTNFAVFALGDTSYAEFCECGKQFDRRFSELGATRILDRVDSDVDYEEPFSKWLGLAIPKFVDATGAGQAGKAPSVAVMDNSSIAKDVPVFGKKNPFQAPLKTFINLNGRGSAKETCHLEFSLEGSGLSYEPGDVVGVFPRNCPEVVEDFLKVTGLRADEQVEDAQQVLNEVLATRHDLTSLNALLLKKYAPIAKNKQLDAFLQPDKKEDVKEWLWGREIRDMFLEFPPEKKLDTAQILGLLRKMPPRLYSIASSLRAHPDEVHLTVGSVEYQAHDRHRKGVCSTYLNQRIKPGDTVSLYTHHNKNFFLPENGETPIIMIGPGTGIAPFRAFVEERDALGQKGKNWLFFGDQHFNTDFLYQLEWTNYLKKGVLDRLDVAFSRDTDHKIYVQHRMKEKARDIYAWMQEGAYFYVCGDANRMAKDVHQALIQIYAEEGGLALDAAEIAVKELQKSKRYQRDVY
ncbi:assimilatory sulfite reductase (NADPH) flavoprotein subunit [Puniceicoccales bacterium CK1056]|uniref:assimilatory sulfite reductase (NADPH) n=1 Tax=Oceanipulchritudo coccoides TaxID=2706888 RepID=A0A6B2LZ26_9BACT|nr:assimilatory sulfite reductase (NADPH) flavoprotein subunit [Oceanipulchritudo coccoides]NDV61888.1 assimilatory sulfite reductase (NADPH) flavoprotein subunit [Oceanipulchritudo coccoides]